MPDYTFLLQNDELTSEQQDVVAEALWRHQKYLKKCRRQSKSFLKALSMLDETSPIHRQQHAVELQIMALTDELQALKAARRLLIQEGC